MLAITVKQPYASLIVHGIKTWETRSTPPIGDMRPAGVRGLPGLAIDAGERIAIHAAAANTDHDPAIPLEAWNTLEEITRGEIIRGAVVGTVEVRSAIPVRSHLSNPHLPELYDWSAWICHETDVGKLTLSIDGHADVDLTDQLPFGFWDAGNWAWELTNPIMFDEPIPATGKQGVWNWDGES